MHLQPDVTPAEDGASPLRLVTQLDLIPVCRQLRQDPQHCCLAASLPAPLHPASWPTLSLATLAALAPAVSKAVVGDRAAPSCAANHLPVCLQRLKERQVRVKGRCSLD